MVPRAKVQNGHKVIILLVIILLHLFTTTSLEELWIWGSLAWPALLFYFILFFFSFYSIVSCHK
jgi:hypothetical protein